MEDKEYFERLYKEELEKLNGSLDCLIKEAENSIELGKRWVKEDNLTGFIVGQSTLEKWSFILEMANNEKQKEFNKPKDNVNNPSHYGGKDNVYEAINVIEAHGLSFALGNAIKYILRSGKKGDKSEDLKKAAWYIERELHNL